MYMTNMTCIRSFVLLFWISLIKHTTSYRLNTSEHLLQTKNPMYVDINADTDETTIPNYAYSFTKNFPEKTSFLSSDIDASTAVNIYQNYLRDNELKKTTKMDDTDNNNIQNNRMPESLDEQNSTKSDTREKNSYSCLDSKPYNTCVGNPEYWNMSEDEYIGMMNSYIFPTPTEWVLIATHGLVFSMGLIGNALVCMAVYRNHAMRTVTNYFIVNLAVADFLVILFCMPPTVLWDVTETWFLGDFLCRILLYFQSVSVTVSVLTLTFISVDRWYAICFPLKFKSTTGRAKTALLVIWLLSLLFNVPDLVVLRAQQLDPLRFNLHYLVDCSPTWSEREDLNWHVAKAFFLYTLPLLLMMVAYCQIVKVLWKRNNVPGQAQYAHAEHCQIRSRRKAAKMLVAVVIMFAVCFFPVHVLGLLRYSQIEQSNVMSCLALLSHVLCYANSAINPLIYNFMSGKFRREFRRSCFHLRCFLRGSSDDDYASALNPAAITMTRRLGSTRLSTLKTSSLDRNFKHTKTADTSFIDRFNQRSSFDRIKNGSCSSYSFPSRMKSGSLNSYSPGRIRIGSSNSNNLPGVVRNGSANSYNLSGNVRNGSTTTYQSEK